MAKTFKTAPRPAGQPSVDQMAAFVRSGAGKDRAQDGPTARMSVDLPESLHRRYKAACVLAGVKMSADVAAWVEKRVAELEKRISK
jgi:hypothetical protein